MFLSIAKIIQLKGVKTQFKINYNFALVSIVVLKMCEFLKI